MKVGLTMSRKISRILPLLILSTIIAGASAAVYNLMYMQAHGIGVEAAKVYFIEGSDSGTDCTVNIGTNGTYVKISNMKGWPNATRVYENVTAIHNGDASDRTATLTFDSWSGDTPYVTIAVKVFNSAGTQQGNTINVGTQGSSASLTIPDGENFRVQWEIKWNAGALSSYSVSVTLSLRVNE